MASQADIIMEYQHLKAIAKQRDINLAIVPTGDGYQFVMIKDAVSRRIDTLEEVTALIAGWGI